MKHCCISNEIREFAADPRHARFMEVRGQMAELMMAHIASDIEDAYQKAVLLADYSSALMGKSPQKTAGKRRRTLR